MDAHPVLGECKSFKLQGIDTIKWGEQNDSLVIEESISVSSQLSIVSSEPYIGEC